MDDARCSRCGGACCETITLEIAGNNNDLRRFIELRSTPQIQENGTVSRNFIVPCSMLINKRCAIYETRPQMCKAFEPGGSHCRATVMSRRTLEEATAILGEALPAE